MLKYALGSKVDVTFKGQIMLERKLCITIGLKRRITGLKLLLTKNSMTALDLTLNFTLEVISSSTFFLMKTHTFNIDNQKSVKFYV